MILDLTSGILTDGDKTVRLSPHETAAVSVILEAYPNIVRRDAIVERVWPARRKPSNTRSSLDATIYNASCKMDAAGIPVPFKTVFGFGLQATRAIELLGSTRVVVDREILSKAAAFLMTHPDIGARLVVLGLPV